MNATLEYATTPLALASLVAILIVGVLKLLVSGKNNVLNKIITHYGFAVVILFGLLGNVAYFYESYQSSETLIIGTVVDERGNYLPRVMIDTGGHARGMTSDSGDFVLAIPKSRIQPEYSISASLSGYKRQVKHVENKSRMFVRFELEEAQLDLVEAMKIGDHRLIIGHYFGLPEVIIQVQFNNPGTEVLQFRNLQMEIVSPSGELRRLVQAYSSLDVNGPALPPTPHVFVEPGKSIQFYFRFVQYDSEVQQLSAAAQSSVQSNPEFQPNGPYIGSNFLNAGISRKIVAAMQSKWFWEPGQSVLRINASLANTPISIERIVTVSTDMISSMKEIAQYYKDGFGIFQQMSLMPVGEAHPGHEILSLSAP